MGLRVCLRQVLLLFALTAGARPGHGFQSSFGDRLLAGLTHAEPALSDSNQRLFDRLQETSIGLMHANLELSFRPRGDLVDQVPQGHPCSDYRSCRIGSGR